MDHCRPPAKGCLTPEVIMYRLLLLALLAFQLPLPAAEPAKKPNILVIYADDQSYKTVHCYPESWPWVKTPNIDALARSGVRFRGAYLGGWCMPSRASFLTGHHPHAVQSMRMKGKYPGSTYDPKQCPFWPALFRKNGYHTAHIGKWHTGIDAGFGRDSDNQIVWNRPKHPENAGAYYEKQLLAFNGKEKWQEGYPADNYTRWAVEYVQGKHRDKSKPWFLWLCYGSVHGPSTPAARHKGMYKDAKVSEPPDLLGPWPGKPDYLKNTLAWTRNSDGKVVARSSGEKVGDEAGGKGTGFVDWVRQVNECVPALDEGVGRLIAALKKTGQLENTLVIYTADQGYAMGEHGLRMKIAPYDSSYRSPLIVSLPGTVVAGKVCKQSANAPDLVATIFALARGKPPDGQHGRDLTPLLKNPAADWPHPCLYEHTGHHFGDDVARVLKENSREAIYQKVPWYTAVVHDGWKYIRYLQPGVHDELYDLRSDPEELKNLIKEPKQAERLARLRKALAAELKRTAAPAAILPPLGKSRKKP
jgi:arylsulfatase A-like enzyme